MTCSMTAFASRKRPIRSGVLGCEIRSVNHRYLDVSVRAGDPVRAFEADIVKRIREKIARGRIECSFRVQAGADGPRFRADDDALARLMDEMLRVTGQLRGRGLEVAPVPVLDVMKWAAVAAPDEPAAPEMRGEVIGLLDETLAELVRSRREEGMRLRQFILEHCGELERELARLREHYPRALEAARASLSARFAGIDVDAAPERVAQEAALLVQKFLVGADVEEELDRCASHVRELNAIFNRGGPVGRRLDFLTQELNREANTISSKAADVETTHAAVEIKTRVERIREQAQNVE